MDNRKSLQFPQKLSLKSLSNQTEFPQYCFVVAVVVVVVTTEPFQNSERNYCICLFEIFDKPRCIFLFLDTLSYVCVWWVIGDESCRIGSVGVTPTELMLGYSSSTFPPLPSPSLLSPLLHLPSSSSFSFSTSYYSFPP